MQRWLLTVLFVLVASPAFAQAQVFKWDQPTSEIATIVRFEVRIDTGGYVNAGRMLGNQAEAPAGYTVFTFPVPALTSGPHEFRVRACTATVCGADSVPHSFTIQILSAPSNPRIGPPN